MTKKKIEEAAQLVSELVQLNPQIEMTLWYGALMSCFVRGHINTGFSYEQFRKEIKKVVEHYKPWFEEE